MNNNYESQSLPPLPSKSSPSSSSTTGVLIGGFPVIAIALLCIISTALLLVIYYILLTKCCLNWQQLDPLRRFSSRVLNPRSTTIDNNNANNGPLLLLSPLRGLDENKIRRIPTFQYTEFEGNKRKLYECAVCLIEFSEKDLLRVLPHCKHGFHSDCIDVWLQTNANCPLCRSCISGRIRYPMETIIVPTLSPQPDHDYVSIDLGNRGETGECRKQGKMRTRSFYHRNSIIGDECIDARDKDYGFCIKPIRRSFSMDSVADRDVYLAIREDIREGDRNRGIRGEAESSGSSSRVRRSFFSFGQGRGTRNAILPVEF